MDQKTVYEDELTAAIILLQDGNDLQYIEAVVKDKNLDPEVQKEILKQIKRLIYNRRSKKGRQLLLIGLLLLGIGFILSVVLHSGNSNAIDIPLYGMTGAGIVLLIVGLIYLFS